MVLQRVSSRNPDGAKRYDFLTVIEPIALFRLFVVTLRLDESLGCRDFRRPNV
jgi:hypothetical protein